MVIEARNLGRRSVADGQWLLREVNLSVNVGDRVAIFGPSGCGKTVLLRSLAMLDPLDIGEIRWHGAGVEPQAMPHFRSQVVYLHQRPALLEGTVEDNLRQPFTWKVHADKTFSMDTIARWLQRLHRDVSFLQKRSRDLSGGESQITALLRAIQLEPSVLLLDEPTSALDQSATEAVEQLVNGWLGDATERRAAVWVSHDEGQAARVSDRSLPMCDGRIVGGA